MIYLVVARFIFIYTSWRKANVREVWEKVLRDSHDANILNQAHLPARNQMYFFELWVENRLYCDKRKAQWLDQLALNIDLEQVVNKILQPGLIGLLPKKIWLLNLALTSAQWFDSESVRRYVFNLAESENQYIAVRACTCLVKLRARGYQKAVIRTLFRFPKNTAYFSSQIGKTGGVEIFKIVSPFLDKLPPNTVLNFLLLASNSTDKTLLPLLKHRLEISDNDREIAGSLNMIGRTGGKDERVLVLPFLNHLNIEVQINALKAITNIGNEEDLGLMIGYLSNKEWWVRYWAAHAIFQLSGNNREVVKKISSRLSEEHAKEILQHAVAESDWCMT